MAVSPYPLWVVPSGESTDSIRGNHNLASHPEHGKPLRCDEVVDGANAEAKGLRCVLLGIEEFLDFVIHESSRFAIVLDRARTVY